MKRLKKSIIVIASILSISYQAIAKEYFLVVPLSPTVHKGGESKPPSGERTPEELEEDRQEWYQFAEDKGYWINSEFSEINWDHYGNNPLEAMPSSAYPGQERVESLVLGNHNFTALSDFSRLKGQIEGSWGSFSISANPNLRKINTFNNLESLENTYIDNNDSLTEISFPSLKRVGGGLIIQSNPNLSEINLPSLSNVEDHIVINAPSITNLDFLANVSSVGRYINLVGSDSLTDIQGLRNVVFEEDYGYVAMHHFPGDTLDADTPFCKYNNPWPGLSGSPSAPPFVQFEDLCDFED